MNEKDTTNRVKNHYKAVAVSYHEQYDPELLRVIERPYPANYFRLEKLLKSFGENNVRRALEVGIGDGTPLAAVARLNIDVWGFDFTEEMVTKAQETIKSVGGDPSQLFVADIQDPQTFANKLPEGGFDGVIAMGVMPHVESDKDVLENITKLVQPGGRVFIEFRNKLFSLFTFNRKSVEFILDDLLPEVDNELRDLVRDDLSSRLRMDVPPVREKVTGSEAPGYDTIRSRFHNPFEVKDIFRSMGYDQIDLHWYHYHPAIPYLEDVLPKKFREEAIAMEHEESGWRGYFLASAFIIEAVKSNN